MEIGNCRPQRAGYTLVELLITMTITLTLLTFGLSAYRQMQMSQQVTAAESSIIGALTAAEKRATVGDKDCTGGLLGIQVTTAAGAGTMTTQAICQANVGTATQTNVANIAFTTGSVLTFQPLAQGVNFTGADPLNIDYMIGVAKYRVSVSKSGTILYGGKQ